MRKSEIKGEQWIINIRKLDKIKSESERQQWIINNRKLKRIKRESEGDQRIINISNGLGRSGSPGSDLWLLAA